MKKVIVIGAGFGGISTAALLAKKGYEVTVLEKLSTPGGRAQKYSTNGFTFDIGPSWYMMPDAFKGFFAEFGKKPEDYFKLVELDPSHKVFFPNDSYAIPANKSKVAKIFDQIEPGAGKKLQQHLTRTKLKYKIGMRDFIRLPYRTPFELIKPSMLTNFWKFDIPINFHTSIKRKFKNPKLQKILEFMVVFLGGTPNNTPALFNLINWADMGMPIYYPQGGFYSLVEGLVNLAEEQGAKFIHDQEVTEFTITDKKVTTVKTKNKEYSAHIVVANADYQFVETQLIKNKRHRSIPAEKWKEMTLSPSAFCIYLGINKKLPSLEHHNLFLNEGWEDHFASITKQKYPHLPQYYVNMPSKTDSQAAPKGCENLFFLVPIASGLPDTPELREKLWQRVLANFETVTGEKIKDNIIHKSFYSINDYINDYNAYQGNAFGLAHTFNQSLFLRPKNWSKKLDNLYYAGQYTNPGTGVPLAVMSSQVVRDCIAKDYE